MTRERGNDGGRTDGDRDGVDRDGGDGRGRDRPRLDRRTLVRTLGAGAAVGATGGLAAAQERAGESRTRGGATGADDAGGGDDAGEDDPGAWDDVVDPLFGFAGVFQENPPVEPDHVVELIIRPREGAPIPEFFFQPTGLSIEPGDTVQFSAQTPHHTVTAYHPLFGYERRVPEDVPAFSSPALQLQGYWLYTFDVEGVYDFHCAPHEVYGHAGRIVVGEDTSGRGPRHWLLWNPPEYDDDLGAARLDDVNTYAATETAPPPGITGSDWLDSWSA